MTVGFRGDDNVGRRRLLQPPEVQSLVPEWDQGCPYVVRRTTARSDDVDTLSLHDAVLTDDDDRDVDTTAAAPRAFTRALHCSRRDLHCPDRPSGTCRCERAEKPLRERRKTPEREQKNPNKVQKLYLFLLRGVAVDSCTADMATAYSVPPGPRFGSRPTSFVTMTMMPPPVSVTAPRF